MKLISITDADQWLEEHSIKGIKLIANLLQIIKKLDRGYCVVT